LVWVLENQKDRHGDARELTRIYPDEEWSKLSCEAMDIALAPKDATPTDPYLKVVKCACIGDVDGAMERLKWLLANPGDDHVEHTERLKGLMAHGLVRVLEEDERWRTFVARIGLASDQLDEIDGSLPEEVQMWVDRELSDK
jgi:hypothetical protein